MPDPARESRPLWLLVLLATFLFGIGAIVVMSLIRPDVETFAPRADLGRETPAGPTGPDTVTLDARAGEGWMGLDIETLATGDVRGMPADWDIAAQRHRLIVNGGEGFLGDAALTGAGTDADAQTAVTPSGDSVHSALDDWYAYNFISHLLQPTDRTWVLRTTTGRTARLRVLGYYCPGVRPGCVTLEVSLEG